MPASHQGRLPPRTVIWLFLAVFVIHDLEEILTVEGWLDAHRAEVMARAGGTFFGAVLSHSLDLSTAQFTVAVLFEFVILATVTAMAVRSLQPGLWLYGFVALLSGMFLHVFTHLGQALLLGTYTPGVVSAVLVALPYSIFAYRRLFAVGMVSLRLAGLSMLVGAAGLLPMVLTGHALGRLLFP